MFLILISPVNTFNNKKKSGSWEGRNTYMGVFEFTFVALLVTDRAKAVLLMWFSLFLVFGSVFVLFLILISPVNTFNNKKSGSWECRITYMGVFEFTFGALLVLMRTAARDLLLPFSTPLVLRSRSASKE